MEPRGRPGTAPREYVVAAFIIDYNVYSSIFVVNMLIYICIDLSSTLILNHDFGDCVKIVYLRHYFDVVM